MRALTLSLAFALALTACGDDAEKGNDATTADTSTPDTTSPDSAEPDSATPDTATPDTATPDTATPDTATPDTATPDTSTPDTTEPEVSEETCGCAGGATCLQAKTAQACTAVATSCSGGGLGRVDACSQEDIMASCERDTTIIIRYFARIEGWLQGAIDDCAGSPITEAGVLTVAEIPAGEGEICSCQRTEAACVQAYGAICTTLACDATDGKQAAPCKEGNRVPGRCVTQDGQRELVFYSPGANAETAESSCLGASATEYYWFPPGL